MNNEIVKIKNIIQNHQFNSNEEFFNLINQLQNISNKLNNLKEKNNVNAFINYRIAYYNINNGKYDEAIELLEANLQYANNSNDNEIKLLTYNAYAILHSSLTNYTDALRFYLKAYDLAMEINDKFTEAKVLNNIGDLFLNSQANDKALDYFLKANAIIGNFDLENNAYAKLVYEENLCICYNNLNNYQLAKLHYDQCQVLCDKYKIDSVKTLLYALGISVGLNKKDNDITQYYNDLINTINSSTEDTFNLIDSFQTAAIALIDNNLQQKAKTLINMFSKIINKVNNNREFMNYYEINIKYLLKFDPKNERELNKFYQSYYNCAISSDKSKNLKSLKSLTTELKLYNTHKQHIKALEKNNQLFHLSYTDDLTKLNNRLSFNNNLDNILNSPQLLPISLLFIDIDYFKEYNDTYGHLEGDKALIAVSNILNSETNNNILAFRYGGDEFTIIILSDSEVEIISYINSINSKIKKLKLRNLNSTVSKYLTISIGYFITNNKNITKDEIIKNADDAVYCAKRSGKNCYKKQSS